eukprot:TRINITY_DN26570_c0_g2_i1.p1 TRINITY_DN26570_c0_g2~~TRINITY_DN26570_c0_g2_i1.p1  ORF type:complete len:544 (+),score=85.66 TRINITY_DN26570_c0_g2_i1:126-1757(+)
MKVPQIIFRRWLILLSLARPVLTVTETAEVKSGHPAKQTFPPRGEAHPLLRTEAVQKMQVLPGGSLEATTDEQKAVQDMQVLPSGSAAAVTSDDALKEQPQHPKGVARRTHSRQQKPQQAVPMRSAENESRPGMLSFARADVGEMMRTKSSMHHWQPGNEYPGEDPAADGGFEWLDAAYSASRDSNPDTWKKYIPDEPELHKWQQQEHLVADNIGMPSGIMEQVADGVGPAAYSKSPASNHDLKFELRRRLVAQDAATVLILMFVLMVAVFVGCLGVYQFSSDPSQVAFYTDPKFNRQRLLCCQGDTGSFLEAFNSQPETASLRVIGKHVSPGDQLRNGRARVQRPVPENQQTAEPDVRPLGSLGHLGRQLLLPGRRASLSDGSVMFDFSLDLSSFISGEGQLASEAEEQKLCQHLASDNPLEIAVLRKKVIWSNWGDVATNIRQKLRSEGFSGDVEIRFDSEEEMRIYRNDRFQNFVRAPITHVLAVLSGVGPLFWFPYLYFRTSIVHIETHFKIEVDVNRYWDMIAAGLSPEHGFSTPGVM